MKTLKAFAVNVTVLLHRSVRRTRSPFAMTFMLTGCLTALAACAWAVRAEATCGPCRAASEMVGGHNLGWVGLLFYGPLLAIMLTRGPCRSALVCIWASFWTHVILTAGLVARGALCPAVPVGRRRVLCDGCGSDPLDGCSGYASSCADCGVSAAVDVHHGRHVGAATRPTRAPAGAGGGCIRGGDSGPGRPATAGRARQAGDLLSARLPLLRAPQPAGTAGCQT